MDLVLIIVGKFSTIVNAKTRAINNDSAVIVLFEDQIGTHQITVTHFGLLFDLG